MVLARDVADAQHWANQVLRWRGGRGPGAAPPPRGPGRAPRGHVAATRDRTADPRAVARPHGAGAGCGVRADPAGGLPHDRRRARRHLAARSARRDLAARRALHGRGPEAQAFADRPRRPPHRVLRSRPEFPLACGGRCATRCAHARTRALPRSARHPRDARYAHLRRPSASASQIEHRGTAGLDAEEASFATSLADFAAVALSFSSARDSSSARTSPSGSNPRASSPAASRTTSTICLPP